MTARKIRPKHEGVARDPDSDIETDMIEHEDAAREAAREESWLKQLLRAMRMSIGRPRPGSER